MRNLQIENDLYYDEFMSQLNFDENFKRIENKNSFVYTDFGNLSGDFDKNNFFDIDYDKTKLRDINKLKIALLEEMSGDVDIRNYDAEDLIGQYLTDYADLEDLEMLLNEYKISYKKTYAILYVSGYSQGDNAQIFVNKEEFKKIVGVDFIEDDYQEIFQNYFYDMPIGGTFNISFDYTTKKGINHHFKFFSENEDSYIDEYLLSSYRLDFDYNYIINSIEEKLIDYSLSEDEKKEIVNSLDSIDYENIKYPCSCAC